jgi:hypothetical protein
MKKYLKIFSIIIIAAFLLLSSMTNACPLCQGGGYSKKTTKAYKQVTLFLGLLPIVGAGGIFYWIYKKKTNSD